MTSLRRRTSASGRISGTLVAAAALLLPAALLLQAEGAAAQVSEPSEITIYHSLATDGADPRSADVPPGCTPGAGGGATTIDFDELTTGAVVTDQFPGVVFSAPVGPSVTVFTQNLGTSLPNFICGSSCTDVTVEFSPPVQGLSFVPLGDDVAGVTAQVTVFHGGDSPTTVDIISDGIHVGEETDLVDLSSFSDVSRIDIINVTDLGGLGFDDFNFTTSSLNCVLGGGTFEELKLWIFGGDGNSNEGETVCAQDFSDIPGEGAGNIIGGNGKEICGAALNFAISGPARFQGVIRATPEEDDGIDTLVFGSPCTLVGEGSGPECLFDDPGLKQLSMNFRTGGITPGDLRRYLISVLIDSSDWNPDPTADNPVTVSVSHQAAGAKLQLLVGESEEVARLPVPEPTQLVQLLSGLFGLAGLNRLRRKH
jgi:hypothetical protein